MSIETLKHEIEETINEFYENIDEYSASEFVREYRSEINMLLWYAFTKGIAYEDIEAIADECDVPLSFG